MTAFKSNASVLHTGYIESTLNRSGWRAIGSRCGAPNGVGFTPYQAVCRQEPFEKEFSHVS